MKFTGPLVGMVAMTFVFGVAVATSVPAASVGNTGATPIYTAPPGSSVGEQDYQAAASGLTPVARDSYAIATPPPVVSAPSGQSQGGYGGAECLRGASAAPAATKIGWPYPDGFRLSDGFGWRAEGFHKGVDMLNSNGTPVHSIAAGVVIAESENGGTGGVYVSIAHNVAGEPICSMYMHFQDGSLKVAVGDTVTAGQVIGLTGMTGNATTWHTHFELYGSDGVRFDPMPWMNEHVK